MLARSISLLAAICSLGGALAVLCYECSSGDRDWSACSAGFGDTYLKFNSTRELLVNCTGEGAMCFVRFWSVRGRRAWTVQRGCYNSPRGAPLPAQLTEPPRPTRDTACRTYRYAKAEYSVCLCQADWCNPAAPQLSPRWRWPVLPVVTPILMMYFTY